MAALSSDLPALRPARAGRRAGRGRRGARAASSPTPHGTGTTLLTARGRRCARGSAPGRRAAHRRRRRACALTGDWPGLRRDVDTAADLRAAVALGVGTAHGGLARRFADSRAFTLRCGTMTACPTPDDRVPLPDDRFLNRELSWLDFNARVLALAEDDTLPLLERAKFLAIFASNLDEFYMVRVAGLKRRQRPACRSAPPTG